MRYLLLYQSYITYTSNHRYILTYLRFDGKVDTNLTCFRESLFRSRIKSD